MHGAPPPNKGINKENTNFLPWVEIFTPGTILYQGLIK